MTRLPVLVLAGLLWVGEVAGAGVLPIDRRAADGYTVQSVLASPEGHNALRVMISNGVGSPEAWPVGIDAVEALIEQPDGSLRAVTFDASSSEFWLRSSPVEDTLYVELAHGIDARAILDLRLRAAPLVCGDEGCTPDHARAFEIGSFQNDYRGGPLYLDAADAIPQFVWLD